MLEDLDFRLEKTQLAQIPPGANVSDAAEACYQILEQLYDEEYGLRRLLGEDPICTRILLSDWQAHCALDEVTFRCAVRELESADLVVRDEFGARRRFVLHHIADWCAHERSCVAVDGLLPCDCRPL